MRTGIIYKAESPSGKVYIGQTIKTLNERKGAHYLNAFNKNSNAYNYALSSAIRKYNNIKWTILHIDIPANELNDLEIFEIKKHNSFSFGYNSTKGGGGIIGYSHSKETRNKISQSMANPSKETRKKISENRRGKKLSNETKKKISEQIRGERHPLYGKKRSNETKKKISKSLKGKINSEDGPSAKLNWKKVYDIRYKYKTGKYTHKKLSEEYDVNKSTIGRIINNITWKIR